ncbi:hypothetical protein ACG873_28025 [Mesorhizobium sp. AaZ16]|uniref:hypothetical protein n=1 Tax=Mesorhizobium sp. AaZ16 TaxID=3402289 RepID=UPI00374F5882
MFSAARQQLNLGRAQTNLEALDLAELLGIDSEAAKIARRGLAAVRNRGSSRNGVAEDGEQFTQSGALLTI